MGRQTAAAGSAVIIGQDPAKVEDTIKTLSKDGPAYGITAETYNLGCVGPAVLGCFRPVAARPASAPACGRATWPATWPTTAT
jgi:hypothetical protein